MFATRPTPAAVVALPPTSCATAARRAPQAQVASGVSVLRDVRIMASRATRLTRRMSPARANSWGARRRSPVGRAPIPRWHRAACGPRWGRSRISSRGCSIASRGSASTSAIVLWPAVPLVEEKTGSPSARTGIAAQGHVAVIAAGDGQLELGRARFAEEWPGTRATRFPGRDTSDFLSSVVRSLSVNFKRTSIGTPLSTDAF